MTEVDRIKTESWISKHYFEPEIKNDFLVTTERKELWACLLDLMNEFQRVCKKHNLTYYAIFGTLLGAMRHKGFVPWDDDLDVAMPRRDYEKLKSLAEEFSTPYALCWAGNEPQNGYSFMKVRNSKTTGVSIAFSNLSINHGLFLDIFPIDDAKPETHANDQADIKEIILRNSRLMKEMSLNPNEITKEKCNRLLEDFMAMEAIATKDNDSCCEYISSRTVTMYSSEKMLWKKEWFENSIEMPFEDISVPVPCGWKEILEVTYGDWNLMPPIADRGKWHASCHFDPRTPYTEYCKQ